MGVRLAFLALAVLGYIIILLSNNGTVDFQFFMISTDLSVSYIIFFSTLFGVIVTGYFYWIMKSYKSLRKKIKIFKEKEEKEHHALDEKS